MSEDLPIKFPKIAVSLSNDGCSSRCVIKQGQFTETFTLTVGLHKWLSSILFVELEAF